MEYRSRSKYRNPAGLIIAALIISFLLSIFTETTLRGNRNAITNGVTTGQKDWSEPAVESKPIVEELIHHTPVEQILLFEEGWSVWTRMFVNTGVGLAVFITIYFLFARRSRRIYLSKRAKE